MCCLHSEKAKSSENFGCKLEAHYKVSHFGCKIMRFVEGRCSTVAFSLA